MPDLIVHPSGPLRGAVAIPGDKSITHRAIIVAGIAAGRTHVSGWVPAEVCLATLRAMRALGVSIYEVADADGAPALSIEGVGLHGLRESDDVLHCAGSGTTFRLLAGLLAGQPFMSVLTGTEPLRRRPMARVSEPLRLMGATVLGRDGRLPPLAIRGGGLHGIEYRLPVASAQVKSALLLAGLFVADGSETVLHEPGPSRDHTERMLRDFGVSLKSEGPSVCLRGGQMLAPTGGIVRIPGDFSSAAFPLVAAGILPGSDVRLRGVGVNPTRTGLWDVFAEMGASLALEVPRGVTGAGEPIADLIVRSNDGLRATEISGDTVVRSIDEFPVLAVAATQADGVTVIRDAAELRLKESDRIASVAGELRRLGALVEEQADGMTISGPAQLRGAVVECHRDHRLAMALAVAGLVAEGETVIRGAEAIGDSFPGFVETMQALGADIRWR